jgi:hypothetical protein
MEDMKMVKATIVFKDLTSEDVIVNDFMELAERYKDRDVLAVAGQVINSKGIRQGRDK